MKNKQIFNIDELDSLFLNLNHLNFIKLKSTILHIEYMIRLRINVTICKSKTINIYNIKDQKLVNQEDVNWVLRKRYATIFN